MWSWSILAACGGGNAAPSDATHPIDASIDARPIDAPHPIDAPTDGAPDAPPPTTTSVSFGLATYDFGRMQLGHHASKTFRLWNVGAAPTAMLDVALAGGGDYTKTADTCDGNVLATGASCAITVQYAPTAAVQTATLTASGAGVALQGTALAGGALAISPATARSRAARQPGLPDHEHQRDDDDRDPERGHDQHRRHRCSGGRDGLRRLRSGPNEPCTVSVQFEPIDGMPKAATLFVLANTGGTTTAQITGTGPTTAPILVFGPASHDFGSLASPTTGTFSFTVTNFGGGPTGTLTSTVQAQLGQFVVAKGQAGDCGRRDPGGGRALRGARDRHAEQHRVRAGGRHHHAVRQSRRQHERDRGDDDGHALSHVSLRRITLA